MKFKLTRKISLITILLISLFVFNGCSDKKIQSVDEETEANEIISVLRQYGIIAHKGESGEGEKKVYDITIEGGDEEYGAAIQLMEDHCLPLRLPPKVESGGLVSSMEVEKAQQLRRTEIDLVSQIRSFPGTTCVKVTIGTGEDDSLSLNPYKTTASVSVKHKTEKYPINENQIRSIVAGGVSGLDPDKVTVSLTKQPLSPLPDLNKSRNFRRILYVSIIGLATILLFVGLAVFLRKRKTKTVSGNNFNELEEGETDLIEDGEFDNDAALLEDGTESDSFEDFLDETDDEV